MMNDHIPPPPPLDPTDPDRLPNPLIRTAELLQLRVVDENGMNDTYDADDDDDDDDDDGGC